MAVRIDDYLSRLLEKRQQAIDTRTAELIAEEAVRGQSIGTGEKPQAESDEKPHTEQAALLDGAESV